MCNACGFLCCGSDELGGCGCDHCEEPDCHSEQCFNCGSPLCDGDCGEWDDVEDSEDEYRRITSEPDDGDPYDTLRDTRRDDRDVHGL